MAYTGANAEQVARIPQPGDQSGFAGSFTFSSAPPGSEYAVIIIRMRAVSPDPLGGIYWPDNTIVDQNGEYLAGSNWRHLSFWQFPSLSSGLQLAGWTFAGPTAELPLTLSYDFDSHGVLAGNPLVDIECIITAQLFGFVGTLADPIVASSGGQLLTGNGRRSGTSAVTTAGSAYAGTGMGEMVQFTIAANPSADWPGGGGSTIAEYDHGSAPTVNTANGWTLQHQSTMYPGLAMLNRVGPDQNFYDHALMNTGGASVPWGTLIVTLDGPPDGPLVPPTPSAGGVYLFDGLHLS